MCRVVKNIRTELLKSPVLPRIPAHYIFNEKIHSQPD